MRAFFLQKKGKDWKENRLSKSNYFDIEKERKKEEKKKN